MDTTTFQAPGLTTLLLEHNNPSSTWPYNPFACNSKALNNFNSFINTFSHFLPLSILKKLIKNNTTNYNQRLYSLIKLCNYNRDSIVMPYFVLKDQKLVMCNSSG